MSDQDPTFEDDDEAPREYSVGYGAPPTGPRWQKGVSGNPNGRPRKNLSRRFLLEKVASRLHPVVEGGRKRQRTTLEIILLKLRAKAIEGNRPASVFCEWARGIDAQDNIEEAVPRAVLITRRKLTPEEWDAKYGHLGNG